MQAQRQAAEDRTAAEALRKEISATEQVIGEREAKLLADATDLADAKANLDARERDFAARAAATEADLRNKADDLARREAEWATIRLKARELGAA